MPNPNLEAKLEKEFGEYMAKSGMALAVFGETNEGAAKFAKLYFSMIWRAMYHFMTDHLYIEWTGDPDLVVTETRQKMTPGGPVEIKVLPWRIINEAAAWKNEDPIT